LTSYLPSEKFKTVTTVHSKVFGRKLFSYKAGKLISVSDSITNHLTNYYNKSADKIRRMKNFIDVSNVIIDTPADELKKDFHLMDRKVILFAGRFSKEKGVDILLRAFKDLCSSFSNTSLVMVGDGEEEYLLKKYSAENKLSVYFLTPVKNIFNFYNIADVVILPSRIDPFPYVMLESGLMKKPFIGSNVDGIPELIKHGVNGLLFEKENIGDLVNSMLLILKDNSVGERLSNELYRNVIDNYTIEKIIPDYIEFYNSLF
jgi:glycosyltransferase involved in cell wall biosynthesis